MEYIGTAARGFKKAALDHWQRFIRALPSKYSQPIVDSSAPLEDKSEGTAVYAYGQDRYSDKPFKL